MAPATTALFCLILGLASASNECQSEESSVHKRSLLQVSNHQTSSANSNTENASKSGTKKWDNDKFDTDILEMQPHVCIIARICGLDSGCEPGFRSHYWGVSGSTPTAIVRAFLASMATQTYPGFELHLLNGPGGGEVYEDIVASIDDVRFFNGPSNPEPWAENTWGYEATNYAMDRLLNKTENSCDYFHVTNADNMYGRYFLQSALDGMKAGVDLLGHNFVSRYDDPTNHRKAHTPMKDVKFEEGHIDLGAVIFSAKAVKEANLRFNATLKGDWEMFAAILNRHGFTGSQVADEVQFLHQ